MKMFGRYVLETVAASWHKKIPAISGALMLLG